MTFRFNESWVIAALLVAGLVGGFALNRHLATPGADGPPPDIEGLLWPNPPAVTPFSLEDKTGEPFTREDFEGRWSLVFFGFTHCPDVCPTTLRELDMALEPYEPKNTRPEVVFVSVDPRRDDVEAVRRYVEFFDPAFQGVTGTPEAIARFTRDLGVIAVAGEPDANGNYNVDHTASILVVGPLGHVVGLLSAPHRAADIRRRFEAIRDFVEDVRGR